MPRIVFIAAEGGTTEVEVGIGATVMEAAMANGVDGIIGECGGSAICGTCHVYVDPSVIGHLGAMREEEDAKLDETACERRDNSRLGCQIKITADLDGAHFLLPERQV